MEIIPYMLIGYLVYVGLLILKGYRIQFLVLVAISMLQLIFI